MLATYNVSSEAQELFVSLHVDEIGRHRQISYLSVGTPIGCFRYTAL